MLGPINVFKLKFTPAGSGRSGWWREQLWLYPDNTRILELSTKCKPGRGVPGCRSRYGRKPGLARSRPGRRPADQDADGARVLQRAVGPGASQLIGGARGLRSGAGIALRWLRSLGARRLVFWAAVGLIPGIDLPSFEAAFLTTGLIAAINALVWPLLIRIVLPLTVLTFGLGSLILNGGIVSVAIKVVDGTAPPFLGAIAAAFVISVSMMILTPALSLDDDARQLRVVRRRARAVKEENRTEIPGVILFEIDGLAEPVLRRALEDGHAPTMARWLEEGSHRVVPWECDLSSQTGASQAGLLLGSNYDMPAFRWYEKESGQTMVSNHGKDAIELERRHSDGGGLLAVGGASRGNMFSGDAPRCSATMSVLRDRQRSGAGEYFAYFADPYGFTRTIALYLWDVMLERRAARRQRKRGEEHVDRGGLYPG